MFVPSVKMIESTTFCLPIIFIYYLHIVNVIHTTCKCQFELCHIRLWCYLQLFANEKNMLLRVIKTKWGFSPIHTCHTKGLGKKYFTLGRRGEIIWLYLLIKTNFKSLKHTPLQPIFSVTGSIPAWKHIRITILHNKTCMFIIYFNSHESNQCLFLHLRNTHPSEKGNIKAGRVVVNKLEGKHLYNQGIIKWCLCSVIFYKYE